MNIRPFTQKDETACVAIFNSIDDEFFGLLKEADYRKWILRSLTNPDHYYYVVEEAGEIVGCGGFLIIQDQKKGIVAWGMVHPDQQKKGYGVQLLDFRIAEIKQKLSSGAIVTLDTTQQTTEFFEKRGFVVTQKHEDYHKKDLHRFDMELSF